MAYRGARRVSQSMGRVAVVNGGSRMELAVGRHLDLPDHVPLRQPLYSLIMRIFLVEICRQPYHSAAVGEAPVP